MLETLRESPLTFAAIVVGGILVCAAGAALALRALPANHFVAPARRRRGPRVLRNILGGFLVLAGIVLSLPVVPGPGILVAVVGLSLIDFPGKRSLQRKLLSRRAVGAGLNRARRWLHRPPFQLPKPPARP